MFRLIPRHSTGFAGSAVAGSTLQCPRPQKLQRLVNELPDPGRKFLEPGGSPDLPGGLSGDTRVQPRLQKYFGFSETQIRTISIPVPSH